MILRRAARGSSAVAVVVLLSAVATALTTPAQAPVGATCGDESPLKPDGTPWVCTLDGEFDGPDLDLSTWIPQTTAGSSFTTGPSSYRACYVDDPQTVSAANGVLDLTVRATKDPFTCTDPAHGDFTTQYQAGEVTTRTTFSQTYGRFEVRAKLPQTTAKGLQETLWLWPEDSMRYGPWPQSGEIDFAEFYSKYYWVDNPTIHYALDPSTINTQTNVNVYTTSHCYLDYTAFNTYAVEWVPGRITLLLNGSTCLVDNYQPSNVPAPAPFDQPFYLALTQALGIVVGKDDNAFDPAVTPLPATLQIDYVRVWQ
jgi:beta-glucanase (GH16 family)